MNPIVEEGLAADVDKIDTVVVAERVRVPRPRLSQLGLNRLGCFLLLLNAIVLVTDLALFGALGLSIKWSTVALGAVPLASLFCVWLNFYFVPGRRNELAIAEFVFIFVLMVF